MVSTSCKEGESSLPPQPREGNGGPDYLSSDEKQGKKLPLLSAKDFLGTKSRIPISVIKKDFHLLLLIKEKDHNLLFSIGGEERGNNNNWQWVGEKKDTASTTSRSAQGNDQYLLG